MLDEREEPALVRGLRAGHRDAWTALYDGYNVDVWRYVARSVGPQGTTVADIVQEVFVAAARSARQFDPTRGRIGKWLMGIAHHHVALHWRNVARRLRERQFGDESSSAFREFFDSTSSVEEICQNREFVEIVQYVLSELPEEYALLLQSKYMDEESLESLARAAGDSTEAVKSRLARARRAFRAQFENLTRDANPLLET